MASEVSALVETWSALAASDQLHALENTGGTLIAEGPDALDFLHRMSTHAVTPETHRSTADAPGDGFLNCFVDKRGRLVEVAHMRVESSNKAVLFCEKDAGALKAFLDGFLFMEDAELTIGCSTLMRLVGGGVLALGDQTGERLPSSFLSADAVRAFDYADATGTPVPTGLITRAAFDTLDGVSPLPAEIAEAARIGAGVPGATGELTDRHNPLELDLHDAIDWKKGCYIGQEVISRIDNYGKQAKRVVAVSLGDSEQDMSFDVGNPVLIDGRPVGTLTSVTLPTCRSKHVPAALALAKVPPLEEVQSATIETANGLFPCKLEGRAAAQTPHD